MNTVKQKLFVINFVREWAGGLENAEVWYQTKHIPALNMTASRAIETGNFEFLKQYLEAIELGGFA